MERKVCFISEAGNLEGRGEGRLMSKGQFLPLQPPPVPTDKQEARALLGGVRGLHAETAQSF